MAVAMTASMGPGLVSKDDGCSTSCASTLCVYYVSPRGLRSRSRCTNSVLSKSGLGLWTSWQGRSHLGNVQHLKDILGNWGLYHGSRGRVQASLLGVGAPEALVIAVVALLVFGPKGLAEVARTLGRSLKAFQPTIRELQQVSREFRSTLEQEIGLDELRKSESQPREGPHVNSQEPYRSDGSQEARAYSSEDYSRVTEEQAGAVSEEQLKGSEAAAWGGTLPANVSTDSDTIRLPTNVVDDKPKI